MNDEDFFLLKFEKLQLDFYAVRILARIGFPAFFTKSCRWQPLLNLISYASFL